MTKTEQAKILGAEAARSYHVEFGCTPIQDGESVGDWDSAAWGENWKTLSSEGATEDDHDACLAAWREAFWA